MSRAAFVGHCATFAGLLEVSVQKPGNVGPDHDFPDTKFHHFLASSVSLEGPMRRLAAQRTYGIGQGVLDAVRASYAVQSGGNAQLGIILLFAPLAKAAGSIDGRITPRKLRRALGTVLRSTSNKDALDAYCAINFGHVGGLNKVDRLDVRKRSTYDRLKKERTTLLEWMAVGRSINDVCFEYASDYEITFELGLGNLLMHRSNGLQCSILQTFMTILATRPDTHISGKWGPATARDVVRRARSALVKGPAWTKEGQKAIKSLTNYLNEGRINPGTTADLTACALFAALLTGLKP